MSSKQKHNPDSLYCQTCANEERCASGENMCEIPDSAPRWQDHRGWIPLPFTLIGMLQKSQKEIDVLKEKLKEARAGK